MTTSEAQLMPPEDLAAFRSAVRRWYRRHGRDLPWRGETDGYRVWIREIMLQQTTVTAVVPYLQRFLAQFPSVNELVAARESDVLKLWEGLGYYSRARNIHKAAKIIANEYGGEFPRDITVLQALPGIGRYTASAIASFAHGQRAAIVEANTLRLYTRLLAYQQNPRSTTGQRLLWQFAEQIIPQRSTGQFNQSLMDLGATVCTASEPDCEHCPVIKHCGAFRNGLQHEIPALPQRPRITDVTEVSLVIRRKNRILVRQRREDERWAGMWDFVRFEIEDSLTTDLHSPSRRQKRTGASQRALFGIPTSLVERLSSQSEDLTGLPVATWQMLTEITHFVTRYRIRLLCFTGVVDHGRLNRSHGYRWISQSQLNEVPLSKTAREIANLL